MCTSIHAVPDQSLFNGREVPRASVDDVWNLLFVSTSWKYTDEVVVSGTLRVVDKTDVDKIYVSDPHKYIGPSRLGLVVYLGMFLGLA